MKIGVIGLGYIGSVTAAVLADQGHQVTGIDVDSNKVKIYSSGEIPIFEPGLKNLIVKNRERISFSTSYDTIRESDVIFIAVPTPTSNGSIDLSFVEQAVDSILEVNKNSIIVMKSTVIPGTARSIGKKKGIHIVSNPEFTSEGTAIQDTVKPDRIIIGGSKKQACNVVTDLWEFTGSPIVVTTNENAELIKYASNSFLATKISFINEIANLCEVIPGSDVDIVAKGMGLDKRIGKRFLRAGIGYGGSCFPKDTQAFMDFARSKGTPIKIVEAASEVNDNRISHAIDLVLKSVNSARSQDNKIAILGLSFKDNTDDVRESQSLKLIKELVKLGFQIFAYDPVVKTSISGVKQCASIEECVSLANTVVVATEWDKFRDIVSLVKEKKVVDVRRILDPGEFPIFFAVGFGNAEN